MYLNDWKDGGFLAMVADFEGLYDEREIMEASLGEIWANMEVLLASYGSEDYGGDAFVLFRRDGKLYEVNGGRCSCYGLGPQSYSGGRETQWEPEETTVEALRHRLDRGGMGRGSNGNEYADELRAVLDTLQPNVKPQRTTAAEEASKTTNAPNGRCSAVGAG